MYRLEGTYVRSINLRLAKVNVGVIGKDLGPARRDLSSSEGGGPTVWL